MYNTQTIVSMISFKSNRTSEFGNSPPSSGKHSCIVMQSAITIFQTDSSNLQISITLHVCDIKYITSICKIIDAIPNMPKKYIWKKEMKNRKTVCSIVRRISVVRETMSVFSNSSQLKLKSGQQ